METISLKEGYKLFTTFNTYFTFEVCCYVML